MSAPGGRARAFVALALGPELGARVAAEVERALAGDRYRIPRSEGLHLTLFFLGETERGRLATLGDALGHGVAGLAPPRLSLGRTGAFPDQDRARVLWVGVGERAHAGRLAACRTAVLAALAGAGVDTAAEEREPFRPHVTVARPRGRPARLPAAFRALVLGLDWDPPAVTLFESEMGAGGSRYAALAHFPFDGAAQDA